MSWNKLLKMYGNNKYVYVDIANGYVNIVTMLFVAKVQMICNKNL